MTRKEFAKSLKGFDWYYAYSDDHGVWQSGHNKQRVLVETRGALHCPFSMPLLRMWAHNMILEDFAEDETDKWFRQPRAKYVASVQREDLIPKSEWDEIENWMNKENDNV